MNIYGPEFFDDDALVVEIKAMVAARREVLHGSGVGVIAGDNRRVEFVRANIDKLNSELKSILFEARSRGLPIGDGTGNYAIPVEFC